MHQKPGIPGNSCIFCGRKGRMVHEGFYFCDSGHLDLFDRKIRKASGQLKNLRKCSSCGRPMKEAARTMIDCTNASEKRNFTPLGFCSDGCFYLW